MLRYNCFAVLIDLHRCQPFFLRWPETPIMLRNRTIRTGSCTTMNPNPLSELASANRLFTLNLTLVHITMATRNKTRNSFVLNEKHKVQEVVRRQQESCHQTNCFARLFIFNYQAGLYLQTYWERLKRSTLSLQTLSSVMGIGRRARGKSPPPWILKISAKSVFLVSSGKKQIPPLLATH